MNQLIAATLFCVMLATICACSKTGKGEDGGNDGNPHPVDNGDTTVPVMKLDKPVMNQIYVSGDTIKIQGSVTDNSLYRGKIKIVNDASNFKMHEQVYEIHGLPSYNFSLHYKTYVTSNTDYTVSVEFEDHGSNIATQTIKVKVNP